MKDSTPHQNAASARSACSGPRDGTGKLPAGVREKIRNHPCYSEDAHHHFARMHVPVAPACNIQCNYCNRKYDCSNESRPGVVSRVLKPEQAVRKVAAVSQRIPELAVVGIAGPGDPLANARRTLHTCELLRESFPELRLCLSTNGLALPEYVDQLCSLGVEHVTVTINAIDPAVGARIHPWVFYEHRRYTAEQGAEILLNQQLMGIEQLAAKDVLVKVNSVLIPGINDDHLPAVSSAVRQRGAFLHNVMPLISEPEHGTAFGLSGQPAPSTAELQAVQAKCAGDMPQMRHCRQCRADAVGFLGADQSATLTAEQLPEEGAAANHDSNPSADIYTLLARQQSRRQAFAEADAEIEDEG
ncbi:nitrogenase cofactor biosynthesis protein NifB [Halorhodospira halochloris]|uniref:nitrogenase cofactor biosynthesis protein NifB n=1 Tax=Halorhodospira halochloris TaxID=1052 RepID=UPI00308432EB